MSDELNVDFDDTGPANEECKQHFNKYLVSERVDYNLTSKAPEVIAAVEYLCKEVGYVSDRAFAHIRMLICNLYMNYDNWRKRYTHLCMSKSDGKQKHLPQYNHFRINYDPLYKSMIYLILSRYARRKKGYWSEKFKGGYETRLIARSKLIELLEDKFSIRSHMIYPYPEQQTIIVRKTIKEKKKVTFKCADGSIKKYWVKIKRPVPYPESTNIIGCRKGIQKYNQLLARTFIDIDLSGLDPEDCKDDVVDLSKKWVRRIFTEVEWRGKPVRRGGRFYGGWWQQVRKELRALITINGRATVEIDFAGLHIHILYALRGKKLGGKEPYVVSKTNDPDNKRALYKRLMLAGVNAKTDYGCITAVIDEVEDNPQDYPPVTVDRDKFREQLEVILQELKEHHAEIAGDINSGKGLRAQYIDSEVAYKVIKKMTDKDIPVLCMHDSFICRDMDAAVIKQSMVQAYIDVITRETRRQKNPVVITDQEVKSTRESIIYSIEEYRHAQKNEVLHALNPVFRRHNRYYHRYIEYLGSGRAKTTFNITINIADEVYVYRRLCTEQPEDTKKYETIMDYCRVTLLQEVLQYREAVRERELCQGRQLCNQTVLLYQGGFCPSAQCLCGFDKLQKFSGTAPWFTATGSQKHEPDLTARKFLNLQYRGK